jgi:hypothetical protein
VKVEFHPLPPEELAAYQRDRARRIAKANYRADARSMGLLSVIERSEADPIPDYPLELSNDHA